RLRREEATALLEEAELPRLADGVGAGGDAELAEDRACMGLDGVEGDVELGGDLALGELAREEPQDGELALGELPEGGRTGVAAACRREFQHSLGSFEQRRADAGIRL